MAASAEEPAQEAAQDAAQDEADPTYTHFAHRAQFMAGLGRFLAVDPAQDPALDDERKEKALVLELGTIVREEGSFLTPARQLPPHTGAARPRARRHCSSVDGPSLLGAGIDGDGVC